jgi:hypothetical protein
VCPARRRRGSQGGENAAIEPEHERDSDTSEMSVSRVNAATIPTSRARRNASGFDACARAPPTGTTASHQAARRADGPVQRALEQVVVPFSGRSR